MKPTIIIEVSGGCVQAVYDNSKAPIRVCVADWDNHEAGDELVREFPTESLSSADRRIREQVKAL